jgi:hypothetical protein
MHRSPCIRRHSSGPLVVPSFPLERENMYVNEDPYLQETNKDQVLTARTNQSNKVLTDHSIVRSNSNGTELSNITTKSDVLLYIKKANEKIKKHMKAVEIIDEELHKITENYFPSKLDNEDILNMANKYHEKSPKIMVEGQNLSDNDEKKMKMKLLKSGLISGNLLHKCLYFLYSLLMPYWMSLNVLRRICRQE